MENNIGVESYIKSFAMNNSMLMEDILQIQKRFNMDLGLEKKDRSIDEDYYPQFNFVFRMQAKQMSRHYELFYCLEKTIRELVSKSIETVEKTIDWWQTNRVPENIKNNVESIKTKELESGVTPRSEDELDYTTFGELSQIITSNWDIFGSLFTAKKAVEKVMASLNTLRGPIAHCSLLSEDEVLRLELTIRDWFRLME
jgi:hypothetical protein